MATRREPSVFLLLVLMVTCFAGLKIFRREFTGVSRVPGAARGDLLVDRDFFPAAELGWTVLDFSSSADAELEPGVFWFVHSWLLEKDGIQCSLSLDQADWTSWHDLSVCYTAAGWTVNEYDAKEIPEGEGFWHAVVLDIEENTGGKGLVIFCNFGSDGTPMDSSLAVSPAAGSGNFWDSLQRRQQGHAANPLNKSWSHERVIQTQVFCTYRGELNGDQRQSLLQLHLDFRRLLRDAWVKHWRAYKSGLQGDDVP